MNPSNKMNPVVHFEMPYENKNRMMTFYRTVFGWEMIDLGPDMMNYIIAKTAKPSEEHDNTYKETARGTIGGGFFEKSEGAPTHPSIVIAVEDIRAAMKRITDNGGKVLGEPMDIPGTGPYVSFIDTEGNRGSILQPTPM